VSSAAAVPAYLLAFRGRRSDLKERLKLWTMGLMLRFLIIGLALYYLFINTDIQRIPAIAGVVIAYFISFFLEAVTIYRSR